MKKIILSFLCAGLITTTAMAEQSCYAAYRAQNYSEAGECYKQQLKTERSFKNLQFVGICYAVLGHYKEALPYLQEAEKKAQTSSDYRIIYGYLSMTYSRLGDNVQDFAYSMKSLALSLKSGLRKDIGLAYNNLGEYYRKQVQLQKALEYYEKALEYNEEAESSVTYGNMAIAYSDANEFSKAEKMYLKSIEIDQKVGDYYALGIHKVELGGFYFRQKRNIEARSMLEDALVICRNGGIITSQSNALSILAGIDYYEGHINEAKEKAAEGLRLARQSGDRGATLSDAQYAWDLVNGK